MARRLRKEKPETFEDDELPNILPLPNFTHRPAKVGSSVWVVSKRRERATLCEIKEIGTDEFVVVLGKEGRKPMKMTLPKKHLDQVDEYLYRIRID